MSTAGRSFGFTRRFMDCSPRRPRFVPVGLFAVVLLLGVGCRGELPTSIERPQLNLSQGDGPTVATDKVDYAPGETVAIDGWGWTPGETVRLQVVRGDGSDPDHPAHQPWDVLADTDGNIASTWLVTEDEAGATLTLTADGQTSGGHAEVTITDLAGTVALYADLARTISQTAYPWGATVYPRLTGGGSNNCYQIVWKDPSNAAQFTETFGPGSTSYNPTGFSVPAVVASSGTWSVEVAQNTGGNCAGPFTSPASPILFDVARAVVIGAGTAADDAVGGDQCVAQGTAPSGGCGATGTSLWVTSQNGNNVRTLLRFDMTAASPAVLPAGATITDAKVRLTIIGTTSQKTYNIERASASWEEGTATFAAPGATGTIGTAIVPAGFTPGAGGGDPQTWVRWGVTADVQGFLDGTFPNDGWRISDASENAASPVTTRFTSTENVCTTGTTCNRVKPVLLIDYIPGPTQLAFITGPFTGRVGECLGPMTVQSQDDDDAALAVTANTTVGLSSDNGGTGAGAFYSNNSCTTGITSVLISSGNANSASFYYRATGRGDGTHELTADDTNPDRLTSAMQTQTINKALTTLTYTGDPLVLIGNTLHLKAVLTSAYAPCTVNKRIIWGMDPDPLTGDPGFVFFPHSFTSASGIATRDVATTNWLEGIYDGRASFPGDADCEASKDDPAIAVLAPGNAATGGGFLAGYKVGGGRANFGFNVRPVEGSDPTTYKGQFLLIKQDGGTPVFRCKGALDTYGTVNGVHVASGRCDFQVWNAALNGGLGGWEVPYGPGYTNRQFVIEFIDNGTGSKGKTATNSPDEFGFSINFVGTAIADPSFARAPINGGDIDAKGGTTTTTTGGGKKKG